jgi:hypothetical protein
MEDKNRNIINGGMNLEMLMQKKIAKPHQTIMVKTKQEWKPIEEEIEGIKQKNTIEDIETTIHKPHIVEFYDKRADYDVNRDIVLKRINKYMNIKIVSKKEDNKNEFKLPILEPDFKDTNIEKNVITVNDLIAEDEMKEAIVEENNEVLNPDIKEDVKEDKVPKKRTRNIKEKEKKEVAEEREEEEEKEEEVAEENKEPLETHIPVKPKYKKVDIKISKEDTFKNYEPITDEKIKNKLVLNRLPKKEKIVVRASSFYMNNRKIYIQKIANLFRPYKQEIIDSEKDVSCSATSNVDFKLLTHQKVVRNYLNIYTPYRGLLLQHMLGSGKTCTSIAIAEGMKSDKPIILMTPASLKTNFFTELKKCGDLLFRKNQYWEWVSIEGKPSYVNVLSRALKIPEEYVNKKKGAWMVDVTKKENNYVKMDSTQQKDIDDQLDLMIRSKYYDINYNNPNLMKVLKQMSNNFTKNPFDNSVVVIDEAHNLVSRIVNKLRDHSSVSMVIYDYLMSASNSKIVLLSGTPIINYPNELAVLFNILRGYIKTWTFQLNIKSNAPKGFRITKEVIANIFSREGFNTFDYIEYAGNLLTITRNPYGFVNVYDKNKGDKKMNKKVAGSNKTKKINKNKNNKTKKINSNNDLFYTENGITKKNYKKLEDDIEIPIEETAEYMDRVPLNMYGGSSYNIFDDYSGVTLDETGNISDADFTKEITHILDKNHIEIIKAGTKQENLKPLDDNYDTFVDTFIDFNNNKMRNEDVFKRRILGLTSYFRSAQEKLLPRFVMNGNSKYHIVPVEMSDFQFSEYVKKRNEEIEKERSNKKHKGKEDDNNLFKVASSYRTWSRALCNFAFPKPPGRPMPEGNEKIEINENMLDAIEDEIDESNNNNEQLDEKSLNNYANRLKLALEHIRYDPTKNDAEQYLLKNNLLQYSPKFLKILENISNKENVGLHLLYSQFRTIEGIGVFKMVLEANGFAEFKIKKTGSSGNWEIIEKEGDEDKPKFVLYTGTETAEEKEIIRNIYNGYWEIVPASITSKLHEKYKNNIMGEAIKVLMITASGAEGINLKNTRYVHIMEPYWNNVRLEQVIGRARRICSHNDLPEELQTVQVFLYLSVFTKTQKTDKKNITIMHHDTSRYDNTKSISTDENLFEIALTKEKINTELLDATKETAIDCSLFNPYNKDENLVCYGFGRVSSNQFSSFPRIEQDFGQNEEGNIKQVKLKLKLTKEINGVTYLYDEKNLEIYDKDAYNNKGELIAIGKIEKEGKGFKIIMY